MRQGEARKFRTATWPVKSTLRSGRGAGRVAAALAGPEAVQHISADFGASVGEAGARTRLERGGEAVEGDA